MSKLRTVQIAAKAPDDVSERDALAWLRLTGYSGGVSNATPLADQPLEATSVAIYPSH